MKPKVGLMLGGGGAKGGYQLGVLRALQEEKLLNNIDVITGTSIGAINGLLLACFKDVNKVSEVWLYAQEQSFYKHGFTRLKADRKGLYSLDILRDVFNHYLDIKKIRNTTIDVYAVAAKILDEKKLISQIRKDNHEKVLFHVNAHEHPFETVIASASIPLFFGTTYIDNEPFVDGGLVDNNPIDDLIEMGCDVILAVPLDSGFKIKKHINKDVLIINFTDLSVFSSFAIQDAYDIIRFTEDALNERQNYGYLVAKEVIAHTRMIGYLQKGKMGFSENFKKVDHFTYIDVPTETYEHLKQLKKECLITKREQKKRKSILNKMNKRITRGTKDGTN